MAKNDLFLLDSILEEYKLKRFPSYDEGEVFEFFATEQILKQYELNESQLLSGSVDGRNDGGMDEFFVFVNGHLAESIPDEFWPKSNATLDIYIITCKHDDSFKQAPITTLFPSLVEIFDFKHTAQTLSESYNEKVVRKRTVFLEAYKRLATVLSDFKIHIIYSCRGSENLIEENVVLKAKQTEQMCQECYSDCIVEFSFIGNETLLKSFRKRKDYGLELKFEESFSLNGQYVVLSKITDYFDFITDEDGKIKKYIFDMNVRDYLGLNPVNQDILQTLENDNQSDFWWLNNGITIIGSDAHIVGNTITVENVQIVNGLQTSESIYRFFSKKSNEDNRSILIKIIISKDPDTIKRIIYATNNQTNVNVPELCANEIVQLNIDEVLKSHDIYYDRRHNTYKNEGISEDQIITPLLLAGTYVCLIHKSPFIASGLKQRFMRDSEKYSKVFSESTDVQIWYPLALIEKKTELFLNEIRNKNMSTYSQQKFTKKYRYIIMFLAVSKILGKYSFGVNDIVRFDLSLYTQNLADTLYNELIDHFGEKISNVKRIRKETYKKIYLYFSEQYSIENTQCIEPISRKLWFNTKIQSSTLNPELIESISEKLPKQPWEPKVHIQIANDLNLSPTVVSNVISYLIFTGQKYYQKYGFVFDDKENIIFEGNHFGYSEDDARQKKKEDYLFLERKFGEDSFNY